MLSAGEPAAISSAWWAKRTRVILSQRVTLLSLQSAGTDHGPDPVQRRRDRDPRGERVVTHEVDHRDDRVLLYVQATVALGRQLTAKAERQLQPGRRAGDQAHELRMAPRIADPRGEL